MANKLKNIFSNDEVKHNLQLKFKDQKHIEEFREKINEVWNEGKTISVDGVESILMKLIDKNNEYDIQGKNEVITALAVSPAKQCLEIKIPNRDICLPANRYSLNNAMCLEIECGKALLFKIKTNICLLHSDIEINQTPYNSSNITELSESYKKGLYLWEFLFNEQSLVKNQEKLEFEKNTPDNIKNHLTVLSDIYEKLCDVEKELEINFNPKHIVVNDDFCETIDEIFELIVLKHKIKYNGSLNNLKTSNILVNKKDYEMATGSTINLTFISEISCDLLNETIKIHTVNVVLNAVISEIVYNGDIVESVIYEGKNGDPLYVAYSAFKTKAEAKEELSKFPDNFEDYKEAKLLPRYIPDDDQLKK